MPCVSEVVRSATASLSPRASGSVIVNEAPRSGALSTPIVPPLCVTMPKTVARPSPVPPLSQCEQRGHAALASLESAALLARRLGRRQGAVLAGTQIRFGHLSASVAITTDDCRIPGVRASTRVNVKDVVFGRAASRMGHQLSEW